MVKRGLAFLLIGCALMLSVSCGKPTVQPTADGFQCAVELTYGEAVYGAVLDRLDPSCASLTITQPPSLDGVSMTWDGKAVTMSYEGVSVSFSEGELPVGAAVKALCKALDACRFAPPDTTVVQGTLDGLEYTLTFDDVSGLPLTMAMPSVPLNVSFYDWEYPEQHP